MERIIAEISDNWRAGKPLEAHTSGSTGTPKPITLSHELVRDSAWRSIRHFGLTADSHLHLCLSPDYIAGKMVIIRALEACCSLSWEPASSHPRLNAPKPITLLSIVGTQLPGLQQLKEHGNLPSIKHLLLGGAPLTAAQRTLALTLADEAWESYGMTETASHIALRHVDDPWFYPLDSINLGTDDRGCLRIELPHSEPLLTNDIIEFQPDTQGFRVLGRADNVIITGGLKVHPEQVEALLAPYFHGDIMLTSVPDPKWGQLLVLQTESTTIPTDWDTLVATLLPPHQRPRRIEQVPSLPRTSNGKLRRHRK